MCISPKGGTMKGRVTISEQLEDDAQVNASGSASCAHHGWPDLSKTQQQQFQEWYVPRIRQRADVLENMMNHCLDQAEAAQARGDMATSRQHTHHARTLQASDKSLGSSEDKRCEAWKYLDHFPQEARSDI